MKRLIIALVLGLLFTPTGAIAGGAKIYVSNTDDNIYLHDLSTGTEEAILEVVNHNNPDPFGLFITPSGDELFSITASGWAMDQEFVVFDTSKNIEKRRAVISSTSVLRQTDWGDVV